MSRIRLVRAMVCVVALALGAGCGGADDDYEQQFEDALAPFAEETPAIQTELAQARTPADFADPLSRQLGLQNEALEELENLEPPDEVADLHDEYVTALREARDATGAAVTAAENGDRKALGIYNTAVSQYQQEVTRLFPEFSEEGYQFEGPE